MAIGAPRWYVDELIELGICTPLEESTTMNEPKTVTREDFDAAMMLLGLSTDPDLALISVHIENGAIMAEYKQRVKVAYADGQTRRVTTMADEAARQAGKSAAEIRTSRGGKESTGLSA